MQFTIGSSIRRTIAAIHSRIIPRYAFFRKFLDVFNLYWRFWGAALLPRMGQYALPARFCPAGAMRALSPLSCPLRGLQYAGRRGYLAPCGGAIRRAYDFCAPFLHNKPIAFLRAGCPFSLTPAAQSGKIPEIAPSFGNNPVQNADFATRARNCAIRSIPFRLSALSMGVFLP